MNPEVEWAARRCASLTVSLNRHRLVFAQMGAIFEPVRPIILEKMSGVHLSIQDRVNWEEATRGGRLAVIADLELCAGVHSGSLGQVRENVLSLIDADMQVLLLSRIPRASYASVPGSSVLEDSALAVIPLLSSDEVEGDASVMPAGWQWPLVSSGVAEVGDSLRKVLAEVGSGVVAALDHALFEVDPKGVEGLKFLAPREIEALRGAGLLVVSGTGETTFPSGLRARAVRDALESHISEEVGPAGDLAEVANGLWLIERSIRAALRRSAIAKYPKDWKGSVIGGLGPEVLRRAQLDSSVAATTVNQLRDPLEWLTLGELMDIVRGVKFANLGQEPAVWRKLQEQLVPVRNRLAHVRMLKTSDVEVVSMWTGVIRSRSLG